MEITLKKIEEELFCINFELKATTDLLIYGKAERWVHGFMTKSVEKEHLDRYNFVIENVKNKSVLDIACGCGYGSYLIANNGNANFVCGVDIDNSSIRYAEHRYSADNIKRYVGNALEFSSDKKFDIIASFETIEHIADYDKLICNFYNLLENDGFLYISTPITKKTTNLPSNTFHEIEWSFYDFHKLFTTKFNIEEIYIQNVVINKYKHKFIHRAINFFSRLILNRNIYNNIQYGNKLEKFNYQYEMNKCTSGYQILVLRKK